MDQPIAITAEEALSGSDAELRDARSQMLEASTVNELAEWFKALSDPTRIKIIGVLRQRELCVQDIALLLEMGQSAVSHQLRYLRNLRMVKRRKEGKTVFYSLNDSHMEEIIQITLQHLKHA